MKITILDKVLYRIPKFPINATLADCWPDLKAAISSASNDFYKLIQDVEADHIEQLPPAVYQTIWKYFNRSKFRATPYGTFAGFGITDLITSNDAESLIIESDQTIHEFLDWQLKNQADVSLKQLLSEDGYLIASNGFYKVSEVIRYITYLNNKFELSEIAYSDLTWEILKACRERIKLLALIKSFIHYFDSHQDMLTGLEYLVSLQLLYTSRHPNIIGEDYFQRINAVPETTPHYIISERKCISGDLHHHQFRHLLQLVSRMQGMASINSNEALTKFRQDFLKRYDMREVPIMEALDPEIGIGYGNLESLAELPEVIGDIIANRGKENIISTRNTLRSKVYETLFSGYDNSEQFIDLDKLPVPEQQETVLPNTFSAMLSDADGLFCLESLGGATANALLGRFTIASPELESFCQSIAATESAANPDVLFFDIAYASDSLVDNVNRRKRIYDLQLTILNFDTSLNPLQISDLYLYVNGTEVVLRSKSLNKRLIPRMATAYNYNRSDLAVFRLLCDIQYQGILPSMSIDVRSSFPGLHFYPRIQYKNIIVSRAKWELAYSKFINDDTDPTTEHLKAYLQAQKVPPYFRAGTTDQALHYDISQTGDLKAFLTHLKREQTLYIEEAFKGGSLLIKDNAGNPYHCEFMVSLSHSEEVYKKTKVPDHQESKAEIIRIIPPGKEWLYFEIFSHPQKADDILLNKISVLLQNMGSIIQKWFFIRYTENGYHLRLRVRLGVAAEGQSVITALSGLLENDIESGVISDFTIRTYKRELERYGASNIDQVESHFHLDSKYVLVSIAGKTEVFTLYRNCLSLAYKVRDLGLFDAAVFDDLIERLSLAMSKEHKIGPPEFKKLNATYKAYQLVPPKEQHTLLQKTFKDFELSLLDTLQHALPNARAQMFADLMHMHFNRLFPVEQRAQEMIFYYLLNKEIKSKAARQEAYG